MDIANRAIEFYLYQQRKELERVKTLQREVREQERKLSEHVQEKINYDKKIQRLNTEIETYRAGQSQMQREKQQLEAKLVQLAQYVSTLCESVAQRSPDPFLDA